MTDLLAIDFGSIVSALKSAKIWAALKLYFASCTFTSQINCVHIFFHLTDKRWISVQNQI